MAALSPLEGHRDRALASETIQIDSSNQLRQLECKVLLDLVA